MDSYYSIDEEKLALIRKQKPWMSNRQNPKYLKHVKVSPSAILKMMAHGQQGVDKGISRGGKPVEVMGLLVGRPDVADPSTIIVSDALPLPAEGFETKVVIDDDSVINHMIELGDSLEASRLDHFCGWYHTHPFDVDADSNMSNCFLSNTDISTQLQWQRSEDPNGNPWLAVVIDPLRSLARGRPEIMAFRVYPPDYNPPANETPDGSIVVDDKQRVRQWGVCWNRYYRLDISYFMSSHSRCALDMLKNKFLWQNNLCSTPQLQSDALSDSVDKIALMNRRLERRGGAAGGAEGGGDAEGYHDLGQGSSNFAFSCGSSLFPEFMAGSAEEGGSSSAAVSSSSSSSALEGLGQGDDSCAPWLQLARSHCSCAARQLTKRCIFEFDAAQV